MKLLILLSTVFLLSACSSVNKFTAIEAGMTTHEVTEELGTPEKHRSNKISRQNNIFICYVKDLIILP